MAMSAAERRRRDRENPKRKRRNATPAEKKRRAARNRARNKAIKAGKVTKKKGDQGNSSRRPEIDHKKKGAKGKTRVMSHSKNRGRNNGPLKSKRKK